MFKFSLSVPSVHAVCYKTFLENSNYKQTKFEKIIQK